jgi:hypothetical protein
LSHLYADNRATPDSLIISDENDETELTASSYLAQSDCTVILLPRAQAPFEDQEKYAAEIAHNRLSACLSHYW